MKKTILFVIAMCVGLVAPMSARAAEKTENPSLGVSEKVSATDAYVQSVEKNISSSNAKKEVLPG